MEIPSPHKRARPQSYPCSNQARRQRWYTLRDRTLLLWVCSMGLSAVLLQWRGDRPLGVLLLHLLLTSGITLSYREIYLLRWARRLRLAELEYHDPWSRPHPGHEDPPSADDVS
jgi:hypothetical protein